MPMRCTEDQDLVGEKDEQGKALSANVESVGERSNNSKFSTHHQDQSMEILATSEGEDEHIHTLQDC